MSKPRSGAPKRVAAGLMAGALATFGLAFASPAFAVEDVTTDRLDGENRWETSQLTAAEPSLADATTAIVASGDNDHLIDSLSAAGIAGDNAPAPIIVTNGDELQPETEAALQAIIDNGGTGVTLLGGAAAVSEAVEAEIEALGLTVNRVEGGNRWETAAAAGAAMDTIGEIGGLATAVIASGFGNAFSPDVPIDALAASPIAYSQNLPVLLTMTDDLPEATAAAITDLGIEQVIIAGGNGVVSDAVEDELETLTDADAIRLGGDDRWATAVALNEYAIDTLGFAATTAILANGQSGVDALGAGPLAGELGAPIVLALDDLLPEPSETFLNDHSDTIAEIIIAGGEEAIGDLVVDDAVAAAEDTEGDVVSNQTFTVTPDETVTLTAVANPDTDNTDDRQFTVTGLDADTTYTIQLFPAANVTTDSDGVVTFEEDGTSNTADEGAVAADITVVNGTVVGTADDDATAQAVNGQISFTVDGDVAEVIVPVIYQDADSDGNLDLDADNMPTEDFGVGGVTRYVPAEGEAGDPTGNETITEVDKDADEFLTANALYEYDSNDRFFISTDGTTCPATDEVTLTSFESQLSVNDVLLALDSSYQPEDSLPSTFCLNDAAPAAPTVTATNGQGAVDLDIALPAGFDSDDTITLERAVVTDTAAPCGDGIGETIGSYSDIATLTTADDEDTATAAVLDYTDTVEPGCYSYRATATLDGEESDASTADTAESTPDTTDPDMTTASPNDINNGVGSTNEVIVNFSEAVVAVDVAEITVSPATQPGLVITVTNATQSNTSGTSWTLTLSQTLDDASADVTYNINTDVGAYEDAAGNENVAGTPDTTFAY